MAIRRFDTKLLLINACAEIILMVIDSLIPRNPTPIALPASSPITKTLLSLMLTSRLTYVTATRHLYSVCLYIDSFPRLAGLTKTLMASRPENFVTKYNLRSKEKPIHTLPRVPLLEIATSIYVTPYGHSCGAKNPGLSRICTLLELLAPNLKRLIFSIPNCCEQYEGYFHEKMVPTLCKLTSLEVFCSLEDSLWYDLHGELNDKKDIAWTHWPKLRTLSLNSTAPMEDEIWEWWGEMPNLQRVVLTLCEGLWDDNDFKGMYRDGQNDKETKKAMELVLVDHYCPKERLVLGTLYANKPDDSLQISFVGRSADPIPSIRRWFEQRLLAGYETF